MRAFLGEIRRQTHLLITLLVVCLAAASFGVTKAAAPLPPIPISIRASDQQITLAWQKAGEAASFRIYRSFVTGRDYEPIADVAAGIGVDYTYRDAGLINGVSYYYAITAVDSAGFESGYSSEMTEMPGPQVTSASFPSALDYPQFGSAPLLLVATPGFENYHPPFEPAAGLLAQVWLGPANHPPAAWTQGVPAAISGLPGETQPVKATASVFPGDLIPTGRIYYVFRFSTNAGQTWTYFGPQGRLSDPATVQPTANLACISLTSQISVDIPSTPGQPVAASNGPDWVAFSWAPSTDNDALLYYDIYRTGPGDDTPRLVRRIPAGSPSFKDTGLRPHTAYTYTIRAVDTAFRQSLSSPAAVLSTTDAALVAVTIQASIPSVSPGEIFINRSVDANHLAAAIDWQAQRMTCDRQKLVCSAGLSLQAGSFFAFRISRGSAETVQTLPDGNTPAPENAFMVGSLNGAMTFSTTVYQWEDPLVVSYSPTGSAVDRRMPISVVWNQAMPASTSFTVAQHRGDQWLPVAGTYHPGANHRTVIFDPESTLVDDSTYQVQVLNQLDLYTRLQQIPFTWQFTTGQPRLLLPVVFR